MVHTQTTVRKTIRGRLGNTGWHWVPLGGLWLCLMLIAHNAWADRMPVSISTETVASVFENEWDDNDKQTVIPAYAYLGMDIGEPEAYGCALHLYGWARSDLGGSDYYEDNADGELLHGFIEYRPRQAPLTVALGRKHVVAGVVNDSLDGLIVDARLGAYLSLLAFGGFPVAYDEENGGRQQDGIYGAHLALRRFLGGEIAWSLKRTTDDGLVAEHVGGVDLSINPFGFLAVNGRSSANLETNEWNEHTYEAVIFAGQLQLSAAYRVLDYESLFSESNAAGVFGFLDDTPGLATIAGGDATWQAFNRMDLGMRAKQYHYDQGNEISTFYGLLFNLYGYGGSSGGVEAGRMLGDTSRNRYTLMRAYGFWELASFNLNGWLVSGEVQSVWYDEAIYEQKRSLFCSLGCGRAFLQQQLEVDLAGSYSSNPYYDRDLRATLVVKYAF